MFLLSIEGVWKKKEKTVSPSRGRKVDCRWVACFSAHKAMGIKRMLDAVSKNKIIHDSTQEASRGGPWERTCNNPCDYAQVASRSGLWERTLCARMWIPHMLLLQVGNQEKATAAGCRRVSGVIYCEDTSHCDTM